LEIKIFRKRIKSLSIARYILSYLISALSHLFNKSKAAEEYENILVIRTDYLGDLALSSSLLSAIPSAFPNAALTLITVDCFASIFANDPNVFTVVGVSDYINIRDAWALISRLRKSRFDLVLDLTPSWWTLLFGIVTMPFVRRYDKDKYMVGDSIRRTIVALSGHYEREYKREHDLIRALRVIKDFYDIRNVPDTYFPLPKDVDDIFHSVASRFNLESKGYFIVTPGSQWEVRRWNVNKFAQAAIEISRRYHLHIVITGVQKEAEICNQLYQLTGETSINLAGQLSMQEFLALIYHSRLLIGNDSGPAHVAAALKIPVVVIMGTADVEVFKPWGTNVRICYREVLCGPCYSGKCYMPQNICLQPVTVEEVVAAAVDLLGEPVREKNS